MADQELFLQHIAAQVGSAAARTPADHPELFATPDQQPWRDRIAQRSREERLALLQRFESEAVPLALQCRVVHSVEEAAQTMVEIIKEESPEFVAEKSVVQHDNAELHALGLAERLQAEQIPLFTTDDTAVTTAKSADATVGITAPSWGIADSASIIHIERPGEPRSTSLLPSVHIALLRLENLLADRDEAYAMLGSEKAPVVFISGPSKTADIEATLVLGAHGPRNMYAIILDES